VEALREAIFSTLMGEDVEGRRKLIEKKRAGRAEPARVAWETHDDEAVAVL
jgi:hypothetical protein